MIIRGRSGYAYAQIAFHSLRVLDVGCGNGGLVSSLIKKVEFICGIDIDLESIRKSKLFNGTSNIVLASAIEIPFANETFDVVTMLDVFEFLPENMWQRSLSEVRRVLKRGGLLIFSVPHRGLFYWCDPQNLKYAIGRIVQHLLGEAHPWIRKYRFFLNKHLTLQQIMHELSVGFSVEKVHLGGLFLFPFFYLLLIILLRLPSFCRPLNNLACRIMEFDFSINYGVLAYNLILNARKN